MTPEARAALLAARETLVALHDHVLRQDAYIDELEAENKALKGASHEEDH